MAKHCSPIAKETERGLKLPTRLQFCSQLPHFIAEVYKKKTVAFGPGVFIPAGILNGDATT
jgi:hypothetical protein